MAWQPDYVSAAEAADFIRVNDSLDAVEIALYASTAARIVDAVCHRQFGLLATPAEWIYTPRWDKKIQRWIAVVDDVATTTGMVVELDGTATTDFTLTPVNAVAQGQVWTQLRFGQSVTASGELDSLSLTAAFGWPAVPDQVLLATRLQLSRLSIRRDSPYGIAGSPADGSEQRLLALADPDVRVSLRSLVRLVRP